MPLPSMHYEYMERKTAKVSSDFHVRFDNAYYSVDKAFLHKKVSIKASSTVVRIYSLANELRFLNKVRTIPLSKSFIVIWQVFRIG